MRSKLKIALENSAPPVYVSQKQVFVLLLIIIGRISQQLLVIYKISVYQQKLLQHNYNV